ncbi:hypothetical protein NEUTE2DRAFT_162561 [Neurospora tetrasperma FGSC 2509]|nr:hypothetical protein NEUTE2DRAFT_162561 [Neurospora tetrasperma FGSC 2509]
MGFYSCITILDGVGISIISTQQHFLGTETTDQFMASAQQQFSPKLRRQTAGQGSSASQVILSPFWKNLA